MRIRKILSVEEKAPMRNTQFYRLDIREYEKGKIGITSRSEVIKKGRFQVSTSIAGVKKFPLDVHYDDGVNFDGKGTSIGALTPTGQKDVYIFDLVQGGDNVQPEIPKQPKHRKGGETILEKD